MADFGVSKLGPTFFLVANTVAAKELCNKHIPSGEISTGPDGSLVFPPEKGEILSRLAMAMVTEGLSFSEVEVSA